MIYASENIVVVEDLGTHAQRLLQHHSGPIGSMALSGDGRLLASAAAQADAEGGAADVCVWDLRSGALLRSLRHHGAGVGALTFSADGAWLASASLGGATDLAGGAAQLGGGCGGEQLGSSGGGGCLVLWDLGDGEPVALGRTHGVSRQRSKGKRRDDA